jgi:hypothetical protein
MQRYSCHDFVSLCPLPNLSVMRNTLSCGLSIALKLVGEGVAAIVRALHYRVGGNTPVRRFPYRQEQISTVTVFDIHWISAHVHECH